MDAWIDRAGIGFIVVVEDMWKIQWKISYTNESGRYHTRIPIAAMSVWQDSETLSALYFVLRC